MSTEQPAQDPSAPSGPPKRGALTDKTDGYVLVPGTKLRTRIKPGPSAENIAHPYVLEHCAQGHTVRLDMATGDLPFGPGGSTCQQCGGRIIFIDDSRGCMFLVPDDPAAGPRPKV